MPSLCIPDIYSSTAFHVWTPVVFKDKVKPVLEPGLAENDASTVTEIDFAQTVIGLLVNPILHSSDRSNPQETHV